MEYCDKLYKMIFFIISYLFMNIVSTSDEHRGICNKTESYIYPDGIKFNLPRKFCCQFFENVTGECKPCARGFTSTNGTKCQKCNGNWYGPRCSLECKCNETQSCDHVHGCVNLTESTTYKIDDISHNTTYSNATVTYASTTNSSKENIPGIETGYISKIGIYIACTGALSVGIGYILIWQKYKKKRKNVQMPGQRARRNQRYNVETQSPMQETFVSQRNEGDGPVYEQIDETALTSTLSRRSLNPDIQDHDGVNDAFQSTTLKRPIVNDEMKDIENDTELNNDYLEPLSLTNPDNDIFYTDVQGED